MIPVVALVGHSNVGKSTLFNCLTRTQDALVANISGLTRDRQYGRASIKGHNFIFIDTGGIESDGDILKTQIVEQSLLAIEEADIVFFIVDARIGIIPEDNTIVKYLRMRNKLTVVVANKTDGLDINSTIIEFWELGLGDIYPIAASHGRGINKLVEMVLLPWIDKVTPNIKNYNSEIIVKTNKNITQLPIIKEQNKFNLSDLPIRLAIVGRPNVGKSMLINRIIGEQRVIVYDMPGTTRDSIYIPMKHEGQQYMLIDTAGVRKRGKITELVEKFSVIKTLKAIEDANVILYIIDASEGISDQDLSLLGFILNSGRALVVIINKWDLLSQDIRYEFKNNLACRLSFINFARVHFISAKNDRSITTKIFKSITEAYSCATRRINTSMLTNIMYMATDNHQPPIIRNRRIKLKYAHAGGYNPPIIVIHGNQVNSLTESYKRYLMNYFRRSLKMIGTPIIIQFKETSNPYQDKRNILTQNQYRKHKRLIRYVHVKKKN